MKNLWIIALGALLMFGCEESKPKEEAVTKASVEEERTPDSDDIPMVESFDELTKLYGQDEETFYLVNFWATWCKPCVEELPYIEALHEDLADQKKKIILVSLDWPKDMDGRVKPFVKDHQLKSDVVMLTDDKMDAWIRKVNEDWDGAIPATIMMYHGKAEFHVGKFSQEGLKEAVDKMLKS